MSRCVSFNVIYEQCGRSVRPVVAQDQRAKHVHVHSGILQVRSKRIITTITIKYRIYCIMSLRKLNNSYIKYIIVVFCTCTSPPIVSKQRG